MFEQQWGRSGEQHGHDTTAGVEGFDVVEEGSARGVVESSSPTLDAAR